MSERTVRNYCAQGKIPGAFLTGKTWNIPENAGKPDRINARTTTPKTLLDILKAEQAAKTSGGIYHKVQIELTYNSNHIEGSRLTHDQTRYIFETNTIGATGETLNVDDTVGNYKRMPNEVGGRDTTPPEEVSAAMGALLAEYNAVKGKTLEDIISFHVRFESIHPFQDGNGRVGRLIMFKECLRNGIVPFIIDDDMKMFYYRGLFEWNSEKGYLTEPCLAVQDKFKRYLDYFRIEY